MAGGAGGAGGSPNGVSGSAGSTSTGYAAGGQGGSNGFVLKDGTASFGPYGAGANGSDTNTAVGKDGSDGAVIITWGGGLAGVQYTAPVILTATSAGVSAGSSGPTGSPGTQPNTGGLNGVALDYAPVSRYWKATSTNDTSFAWNRALGFRSLDTNITTTELNRWGFDLADAPHATNITLTSFSANVDRDFTVGYAVIQHGATSVAQSRFVVLGMLSDLTPNRNTRSSSDPFSDGSFPYGKGPWNIPTPGPNEFVYLWVSDTSGSDTRSITVTYTAQ